MKLSVLMITYNQEQFIAQALDSALMQRVDFDFEIVVGEDCSTDGTREILVDYQRRFPDKIRLLLPKSNLGMVGNFVTTLNACRGEYIALLEGDDYWSSPDKLQKQVHLLDNNPECRACFHNVFVAHDAAPELDHLFHEMPLSKKFFNLNDIVSSHFIPTCSTVFRARLFNEFPDWFMTMPMCDWPLHILNAEHGTYAYIDEVLATYRIHGGGVWSGMSRLVVLDRTIYACHLLIRYLKARHPMGIGESLRKLTYEFELESSEILKSHAQFLRAFIRLFRAFLLLPNIKLFARNIRRLLVAFRNHYFCIGP